MSVSLLLRTSHTSYSISWSIIRALDVVDDHLSYLVSFSRVPLRKRLLLIFNWLTVYDLSLCTSCCISTYVHLFIQKLQSVCMEFHVETFSDRWLDHLIYQVEKVPGGGTAGAISGILSFHLYSSDTLVGQRIRICWNIGIKWLSEWQLECLLFSC